VAREVISDLAMLERLAPPAGRDVLDIGCGGGQLVRALAARGARVVGVEVSEGQLAAAVAHDAGSGARYLIGRAEALPVTDASVDLAVFMRTLHHVPAHELLAALKEARRVLRAEGLVYVAEPLAEGDYFELLRLVEDEVEARAAAQAVLANAHEAGLERVVQVEYDAEMRVAGLQALHDRMAAVDPQRSAAFALHETELQEVFATLGDPGERPGERRFRQPMRAEVLRPVPASR
jgi:ubiquinone/menaquinone biosynthesis C-methylase UbiE